MNRHILVGDVLEKFKEIPDESIDCIITSPPYWGLRNYGIEGQMGLEKDFNEYLDKLDLIMDECWRVLKPTGTCWINLGDTYSTVSGGMRDLQHGIKKKHGKISYGVGHAHTGDDNEALVSAYSVDQTKLYSNLKHKSRVGIPERFYIRCIDKGWVARNHIPWIKANSMPSSVKDRFTNKWESIFFFAKKPKGYYFDLDAVRVAPKTGYGMVKNVGKGKRKSLEVLKQQENMSDFGFTNKHNYGLHQRRENGEEVSNCHPLGKNPGDIFEINTKPCKEAHFATFPPTLPEKILKCSCPKQLCKKCGKARVAIKERQIPPPEVFTNTRNTEDWKSNGQSKHAHGKVVGKGGKYQLWLNEHPDIIKGYTECGCNAGYEAGTVLDPFFGAGTVGMVAEQLDLNWVGIEINPEYVEIAKKRIGNQEKLTKHL